MHYGEVEFAVRYRCAGCDKGVVAVLRRIAAYHEKGTFGKHPTVGLDNVFFGIEFDVFVDGAFKIHHYAAAFLACEAFAHGSVEAYAECAEERLVVGRSVVCIYNVAFGNHPEGAVHVDRYAKVACESVA